MLQVVLASQIIFFYFWLRRAGPPPPHRVVRAARSGGGRWGAGDNQMLSQQRVPNEIGREREYLLPQSEGIVLAIMFRLATASFIIHCTSYCKPSKYMK